MKLSKAPKNDYFFKATIAAISHDNGRQDERDDQSPPVSPLKSPQLSSSSSSISGWSSAQPSPLLPDESDSNGGNGGSQCNTKEDRAAYNTKFARYHLETYRQNDRMRWNFDFDHNRPLDESPHHHHHHQTVARYQWEPAI